MSSAGQLPRWVQLTSIVVVYSALAGYAIFHFLRHSSAIKLTAQPCPTAGQTVEVTIANGKFTPDPLNVKRCDRVTIHNTSLLYVEPALGPHQQHIIYPTFSETALKPGQSMQFLASVPGTYELHDHIRDQIESRLTVSQ